MSALSRLSREHAATPHRPRWPGCRTSRRRRSWIDLLQKGFEIGKAFAPEHAVMAHPVDQGAQPLGLRAVVNVASFGTFGDQPGKFERFEMLRDRALRHPAAPGQFDHRD